MSKDLFIKKCAEHGLKVTPQRVRIYEELRRSFDHPSADMLYQRVRKDFPHISFDTVYRTLLSFSEIGIIHPVEGYHEQKRFETNAEPHHHFYCIKCRKIMDFMSEAYNSIMIPKEIQQQCTVLTKKVVLEGVCKECR